MRKEVTCRLLFLSFSKLCLKQCVSFATKREKSNRKPVLSSVEPCCKQQRPALHRSVTISLPVFDRYIFRRNQSSIAGFSWSSGTFLPISITPSATGRVSSKMLALVKFLMEKLSSHFSGQARRWPSCSYSTRILRANIHDDL